MFIQKRILKTTNEKYKELEGKGKGNVFQLPVAQELDGEYYEIQSLKPYVQNNRQIDGLKNKVNKVEDAWSFLINAKMLEKLSG